MPLNDCQNKYPINVPKVLAIISSISKNLPANNCRNSIEHENTPPLNNTFFIVKINLFKYSCNQKP